MITVMIKKDDQGQFFVSVKKMEEEMEGGEMEQDNGQQAQSMEEALMLAGRLLSKDKPQGMSPFDQGLKSVLPTNGTMGNMPG